MTATSPSPTNQTRKRPPNEMTTLFQLVEPLKIPKETQAATSSSFLLILVDHQRQQTKWTYRMKKGPNNQNKTETIDLVG